MVSYDLWPLHSLCLHDLRKNCFDFKVMDLNELEIDLSIIARERRCPSAEAKFIFGDLFWEKNGWFLMIDLRHWNWILHFTDD